MKKKNSQEKCNFFCSEVFINPILSVTTEVCAVSEHWQRCLLAFINTRLPVYGKSPVPKHKGDSLTSEFAVRHTSQIIYALPRINVPCFENWFAIRFSGYDKPFPYRTEPRALIFSQLVHFKESLLARFSWVQNGYTHHSSAKAARSKPA